MHHALCHENLPRALSSASFQVEAAQKLHALHVPVACVRLNSRLLITRTMQLTEQTQMSDGQCPRQLHCFRLRGVFTVENVNWRRCVTRLSVHGVSADLADVMYVRGQHLLPLLLLIHG